MNSCLTSQLSAQKLMVEHMGVFSSRREGASGKRGACCYRYKGLCDTGGHQMKTIILMTLIIKSVGNNKLI